MAPDANSLKVQIHSIQGDVDNARSTLSHAWAQAKLESDTMDCQALDSSRRLLIKAGEQLEEIVQRISKLAFPR